jgi:hypothetical protein
MSTKIRILKFMGFPGYGVSRDGRGWTRMPVGNQSNNKGKWKKWRPLNPSIDTYGYHSILLHDGKGRNKRFRLHELILLAYVGPRPEGKIGRHFPNRDPSDNRLVNVSWATPTENAKDREYQGSKCQGSDYKHARFTESEVVDMRKRYRRGEISMHGLAKEFHCAVQTIHFIIHRKTWKHV